MREYTRLIPAEDHQLSHLTTGWDEEETTDHNDGLLARVVCGIVGGIMGIALAMMVIG